MPSSISLRLRLMMLILIPLAVVSIWAGFWRISSATGTTRDVFDRTLIALTLAISSDIHSSEGELLSEPTKKMLQSSFSGNLYYHVHGPDGVFITGYATPPIVPPELAKDKSSLILYEANYRGEKVRVARLKELTEIDAIRGYSAVTVWQTMLGRDAFIRNQALQAVIVIVTLF